MKKPTKPKSTNTRAANKRIKILEDKWKLLEGWFHRLGIVLANQKKPKPQRRK